MIPIAAIQRTAEALMAKAAIEIPDDYLDGLRRAADTEKGDLSAFVIQAMLENYEAAKEDRRAMCGDTGVPRWYVKLGNDARQSDGGRAEHAGRGQPSSGELSLHGRAERRRHHRHHRARHAAPRHSRQRFRRALRPAQVRLAGILLGL